MAWIEFRGKSYWDNNNTHTTLEFMIKEDILEEIKKNSILLKKLLEQQIKTNMLLEQQNTY